MADYARVQIRWHGPEIKRDLRRAMSRRIAKAAGVVKREALDLIGTTGTGKRARRFRRRVKGTTQVYRKGAKILGASVSAAGEPPRKQTGRLYRSVKVRAKGLRGRVYTKDQKAHLLEFGTKRMAARPWLNVALANRQSEVNAVLSAPLKLGK